MMIEYKLQYPVKDEDGAIIDKLCFNLPPNIGHLKAIEKLSIAPGLTWVAKIIEFTTGKSEKLIDKISSPDMMGISELLDPYLKKSPETSPNA